MKNQVGKPASRSSRCKSTHVTIEKPLRNLAALDGATGRLETVANATIHIRTFGALSIVSDQGSLGPRDLGGVKPKQVFELLLLAKGRPVSKSTLAEHLWGDDLPKHLSATLENYVSILRRRLLEGCGAPRDIIVTEHEAYRLNVGLVSCDLFHFEEILADAKGQDSNSCELYQAALRLATAPMFEDELYSDWCFEQRERVGALVVDTHIEVAALSLRANDPTTARHHGEAALALAPTDERAVRCLMRSLAALGTTQRARTIYADFCGNLKNDFGVEPDRETRRLFETLCTERSQADLVSVANHCEMQTNEKCVAEPLAYLPKTTGTSDPLKATLLDACALAHRSGGREGLLGLLRMASQLHDELVGAASPTLECA